MWCWIIAICFVDKVKARVTSFPCRGNNVLPDFPRRQSLDYFAGISGEADGISEVASEMCRTTLAGWKKTDISWRGSMGSVKPFLGIWAPTATTQELKKLNLANGQHALKVKWINKGMPGGRAVFKAGLREGDYILALNGTPFDKNITPQRFTTHIKLNYKSGQKLPVTLMRNGKRVPFKWLLP